MAGQVPGLSPFAQGNPAFSSMNTGLSQFLFGGGAQGQGQGNAPGTIPDTFITHSVENMGPRGRAGGQTVAPGQGAAQQAAPASATGAGASQAQAAGSVIVHRIVANLSITTA